MVSASALHSAEETDAGLVISAAVAVTAGPASSASPWALGADCPSVLLFAGTALAQDPREGNTRRCLFVHSPRGCLRVPLLLRSSARHRTTCSPGSACSSRPPSPHTLLFSVTLSARGAGGEGRGQVFCRMPFTVGFLALFSWACLLFLEVGERGKREHQ